MLQLHLASTCYWPWFIQGWRCVTEVNTMPPPLTHMVSDGHLYIYTQHIGYMQMLSYVLWCGPSCLTSWGRIAVLQLNRAAATCSVFPFSLAPPSCRRTVPTESKQRGSPEHAIAFRWVGTAVLTIKMVQSCHVCIINELCDANKLKCEAHIDVCVCSVMRVKLLVWTNMSARCRT